MTFYPEQIFDIEACETVKGELDTNQLEVYELVIAGIEFDEICQRLDIDMEKLLKTIQSIQYISQYS